MRIKKLMFNWHYICGMILLGIFLAAAKSSSKNLTNMSKYLKSVIDTGKATSNIYGGPPKSNKEARTVKDMHKKLDSLGTCLLTIT